MRDLASELREILADQDDESSLLDRAEAALQRGHPRERTLLKFKVFELLRPSVAQWIDGEQASMNRDQLGTALVTAFILGVVAGREHARRGYALPPPD